MTIDYDRLAYRLDLKGRLEKLRYNLRMNARRLAEEPSNLQYRNRATILTTRIAELEMELQGLENADHNRN